VLATKFFMPMGDGPNRSGGSRKWIMQAIDSSLRRLDTDFVDLYPQGSPTP
jgi:aryl-alcohol dehydrogenase-like predicted oxidoreductase